MASKLSKGVQPMRIKNLVLGVGIFIVYMMMLVYGIQTFKPSPEYGDFCKPGTLDSGVYPSKIIPTGENCTYNTSLQEEVNACYAQEGQPVYSYDSRGCTTAIKECNLCNKEFEDARVDYDKFVFVAAIIIGIITLFVGYGILSIEPVGSALMASGVGAIVYGAGRNWQNLSNVWRFSLLLVALILLIWIAVRLNRKK